MVAYVEFTIRNTIEKYAVLNSLSLIKSIHL